MRKQGPYPSAFLCIPSPLCRVPSEQNIASTESTLPNQTKNIMNLKTLGAFLALASTSYAGIDIPIIGQPSSTETTSEGTHPSTASTAPLSTATQPSTASTPASTAPASTAPASTLTHAPTSARPSSTATPTATLTSASTLGPLPTNQSSSSSSTTGQLATAGIVVASVVVAAAIGIWVFRKWKLSVCVSSLEFICYEAVLDCLDYRGLNNDNYPLFFFYFVFAIAIA